jgi:peptide/nickel transport system permease protein
VTRLSWLSNLVASLWSHPKGRIGLLILLTLVLLSALAPMLAPYPPNRVSGVPLTAPGVEHLLGTTRLGKDVLSQTLYGGRISLGVGFFAGLLATVIALLVGVTAGYIGGWIDDVLSFVMNLVLILPAVALIIVIASSLERTAEPLLIAVIIAATSWAWEARLFRAQTLSVSQREYISAAKVIGEPNWRIILFHIIPNLSSLITSAFVLGTLYCIVTEAGLEFIGIGNPQSITWGVQLLHARTSNALIVGGWWELLVPSMMILLTGAALAFINFAVDEITNPRLQNHKYVKLQQQGSAHD